MLGAIGGFIGRVFGAPENASKTADMIRDGLDKIVFTKEEQADYTQASVELYLEFIRMQTDGGHLARRWVALIVTAMWFWSIAVTIVLLLMGSMLMVESMITIISEFVVWPFVAVMTYYFGHRILQSAARGK